MTEARDSLEPGTYSFINLGCPKNLVDSERVAARLESAGWREAAASRDASLLVVTTCAFITSAEEESIGEILEVASSKRERQKLAVLGCLVTREGERLERLIPEVDLFLSVEEMELLADKLRIGKKSARDEGIVGPGRIPGRKLFTPHHIAYLKIAEGCSNHCSYCTIPSIRGELRSRQREEIITEAAGLVDAGVKELVVVAQDTGAYGLDGGGESLYDLIEGLGQVAGSGWVRLMYLHPAHIDMKRMLDLLERNVICRYLDIPIQHVSDSVLDRMGRGYNRDHLERLFTLLRRTVEDIVLRTTVMVGFPGESESDFKELSDFIEEFSFDHVGVFVYSPETGTVAARLGPRIPPGVAERRRDELLDIQMDRSQERLGSRIGRAETILVDELLKMEERPRPGIWGAGRYYGQAFEVDGVTFLRGAEAAPGDFVRASIYESGPYDLFASTGNLD